MSADNGIYVAKFPDGYRVAYAMAIDNIDYFPVGSRKRKKELYNYFGGSEVFNTKDAAFANAYMLYEAFMEDDDFCILEYGIQFIGEYESFS
jgi:hypothetical protein